MKKGEMLMAGKWKICNRHGSIFFSIAKDIILNSPNKISPPDSLSAKYKHFSESRNQKREIPEIWRVIKKLHPNSMQITILQVEDYHCLVTDGICTTHDYRMFLIE